MYKELKGEYGRRKDCEDWEKEGVNEKDNVKENNRSEKDRRKPGGGKEGERKDGEGTKMEERGN